MTDGALFDAPTGGTGSSGGDYFAVSPTAPLAARMRPRSLDEVAGQDHVLAAGKPLRRLIEGSGDASVILYGPPGTGKTTIASLISQATARKFVGLSALNSGVKEVRAVIDQARRDLIQGMSTVLFIDEVHRFSKTQQDALLAAVENRVVLLVAATTENPSFSVVAPLLSRSLIVKLESLDDASVRAVLRRALVDERGLGGRITASDAAIDQLVALSGGDARRSLTYLEAAAESVPDGGELSMDVVAANIDRAVVRYDRDGDQHYDVASAFIKSRVGCGCGGALSSPNAGGGGGPPVCGPQAGDRGRGGCGVGRPASIIGGGGRGGGGAAYRHAGGADSPGGGHNLFSHRTKIECGVCGD